MIEFFRLEILQYVAIILSIAISIIKNPLYEVIKDKKKRSKTIDGAYYENEKINISILYNDVKITKNIEERINEKDR